jgi:hypothetical protein
MAIDECFIDKLNSRSHSMSLRIDVTGDDIFDVAEECPHDSETLIWLAGGKAL